MQKISETSKGVFFIILSAFFFALMAAFVRLAGDICFIQKTFFRNSVAFLIALAGFIGYAIIILMALVNFVYNAKKS